MNSKNIILLFLGSIFFLSVNAQLLTPATETYIDSLMRSNYTAIEPGAVLLIAEEGKPVYRKAFGLASVELAVPNREDYVFAIGSMTKQFTAIALLQLVGQGKVQLQDDIRLYLPDYNTHGETITLENLITHTSGIPSFTEMDTFNSLVNTDIGLKEMTGIFQDAPLLFTPGTDWSYSNSGFNLAGMIIEKVSGMTYGEYLQKHIFDPLRMESTSLGAKDKIIPRFVNGYQAGATTYMPASEFSWTWPYAAGQIISNVDDLLKWDEALYTNTILDSALIHRAFTNYVLTTGEYANYGYGWAVDSYAGLTIIRHGGAISGFLSDAVRIPEKHLYIALLSNNTKQSPGEVTDAILNVLLQLNITGEAVSTDAAQLKKYTGVYEVHRSSGRLVSNYSDTPVYRYITVEGDALYMQRTGGAKQKLTYLGNGEFYISNKFSRIRFGNELPDTTIATATVYDVFGNYGPKDIEKKTALPLPSAKTEIELPEAVLQNYVGNYDLGGGFFIRIFIKDHRLYGQATGQAAFQMFASSETAFFLKIVDATIEFTVDAAGTATGLILRQGGTMHGTKVE